MTRARHLLLGLPGVTASPVVTVLLALLTAATPTAAAAPGFSAPPSAAPPSAAPPSAAPPSAAPPSAGPGAPPVAWDWPVDGVPMVLRDFDPPARPWLAGHRGVDLAAPAGRPVRVAGAGVVAFAGPVAGRGVVSVAHAGGLRTTYEPVRAQVRPGQPVELGQPLGTLELGHAGCPSRGCVHWGLRRGDTYLDPLSLVRPRPVRLKPWAGAVPIPLGPGRAGRTTPSRPVRRRGVGRRGAGGRRSAR